MTNIVAQMMDALELDQYGEKGLKEIIRQMVVEIVKRSEQKREPLSDSILSKEVDIIKKDADFSNVRPWQIYYLMRKTEELHGIGVDDE